MFHKLLNLEINPVLLLTWGLSFELLGAILIAMDAIGIKEFLKKLRSETIYETRTADLGITAFINRTITFLIFGAIFAVVTTALGLDLVLALLLAPFGFVLHRLISRILEKIYSVVLRHSPKLRGGCFVFPLSALIWFLWLIAVGLTLVVYVGFDLGFVIIIYRLSEKYLKPMVIKGFDFFNEKCIKKAESRFFKPYVVTGILLIFWGFVYQIAGTILIALD